MWFFAQFFQTGKCASLLRSLMLIPSIVLFSFSLSGCGESSSTSSIDVTNDLVSLAAVAQSTNFQNESFKLVPLTGYEQSGLQIYWPSNSDVPSLLQEKLQLVIPKINTVFSQQNFAFTQPISSDVSPLYKKLIFTPVTQSSDIVSDNPISFSLADDGAIIVMLAVDALLANADSNALLSVELTNIIYQSERLKYQLDNNIFQSLVSRGLALHFLKENLSDDEINFSVEIEPAALAISLVQVKESLSTGLISEELFTDEPWYKQSRANALAYYLAEQHFTNYGGSSASNSFSVTSELFLSWLDKASSSNQKTEQYVRTGNVPDQIAIEELARQASLYLGSYFIEGLNHEKLIALSFDDGPSQYTTQILDVLEEAQVPASFFWQGQNLANYKAVVTRSIAAGHTVANHSWNHTNGMSYSDVELWQQQVVKTNNEFQQLFNISPRFYRPPYGEITDEQIEYLAAKGMKVMLWSVDSRDWNPELNSVDRIESELINNQHEEVITLMHDAGGNRQNTVDSLPAIIAHYKSQGYRFVNLETLVGISDKH